MAPGPVTSGQIEGGKGRTSDKFPLLGFTVTAKSQTRLNWFSMYAHFKSRVLTYSNRVLVHFCLLEFFSGISFVDNELMTQTQNKNLQISHPRRKFRNGRFPEAPQTSLSSRSGFDVTAEITSSRLCFSDLVVGHLRCPHRALLKHYEATKT